MAGFETIVRPVVFPNIRPAPAQPIAPMDEPDKGVTVLSGGGGKLVALPYTYSMNFSRSKQRLQEEERVVDVARVYQKEKDGQDNESINRENYLDVEVIKKWIGRDATGVRNYMNFARGEPADNVEILQKDVTKKNPDVQFFMTPDTRLPVDDR